MSNTYSLPDFRLAPFISFTFRFISHNLTNKHKKKACIVFVVKEVLAKPKQKTKNNPRLITDMIYLLPFCFGFKIC